MAFGVDLAWGRPSIASLKAAGVTFVMRYLSHDTTGKNLSRPEAQHYTDNGISTGVVWETMANRALAGYAAGAQDARDAMAQASSCGMPSGRPIFFAVDFDASPSQKNAIIQYFKGVASVLGTGRTGAYGGYYPIKWLFDAGAISYGWQTYAWSGGQWDKRAQLQQYSNDHTIGGVGLDYDRSLKSDFGQWKIGQAPAPQPDPAPDPHTSTEDDEMITGTLNNGQNAPTPICWQYGAFSTIGFCASDGQQGKQPAALKIEYHDLAGWHTVTPNPFKVSGEYGESRFTFPKPNETNEVIVTRADAGDVNVAYVVFK